MASRAGRFTDADLPISAPAALPRIAAQALGVLLVLVVLVAAGPASGQVSPEREAAGKEHQKRGLALVDEARFLEAIEEFKAAYAADPRPGYLFNVGRAYQLIGQYRNARDAYNRTLDQSKSEEQKETLRQLIAEMERLGSSLTLLVTPEGSSVEVDGDAGLCVAGQRCLLDPGEHTVKVASSGYAAETRKVKLAPGEAASETVALVLVRTVLKVGANVEGALVSLDGKPIGKTPLVAQDVTEGPHRVRVEMRGFEAQEKPVTITKGQTVDMVFDLPAVVVVTREGVLWRSAAFPGLGQFHADHDAWGTTFLVSELVCLGTAAAAGIAYAYFENGKIVADEANKENNDDWWWYRDRSDISYQVMVAGLVGAGSVWALNLVHAWTMSLPDPDAGTAPVTWEARPGEVLLQIAW